MKLSLETLIPETVRLEGPDIARRARAVVIAAAIVSVVGAYIAWVQVAQGSRFIGVLAMALAVFAMLGGEFVRRTGRWRPVGAGICIGIFVGAASVVAITGGTMPAASFYLGLVPVVATIFFGARPGGAVVLVNVLFLTGIEALRRNHFEFPLWIPEEVIAQSAYRGAMIFEGILFAMALIYDVLRRASLGDVAESEARYRALSTQRTDLVFEVDAEGIIQHAAPGHAAALGWTSSEVVGQPARSFLHEADQDQVAIHIGRALREGSSQGNDLRIIHRDGSWHWYGPSITAFESGRGERRVMVIARSLDERLDSELRQRQSQKMDAVGQLASGVAHDFNNLLMVVGSYAQMLSHDLPAGEQRDAALEILNATEQGEALTRQLVAVGRPASQSIEPIDPNDVIRHAERILTRLAGESVAIDFSLDEGVASVLADPGHLDQILVNLTVNARDAMPDGGVLSIRTAEVGDQVVLEVADTGIGIDSELRDRIFEAFFTTKSRQHGTGLGLYVVYTLVQEMGGRVEVDSEVGSGTTITIALPAVRQKATVVPMELNPDETALGGRETILLVEDRAQLRRIVQRTLTRAGYQVVDASNGWEGVGRARSHDGPIDLVLSDVVMPEMTGPEMVRILRDELEGTRFLFMSGHPDRAREVAEELSDDTLIMKPIVPPELLRRVRDALDRAA